MQYRAITGKEELDAYLHMVRAAFTIPPDESDFWKEIFPLTPENSRGLFDDDGQLLCGLVIVDGGALYFGTEKPITTALITAVASPPEQRRKGYIRELFKGMFDEEKEKGVALTALYPFYFPFYRSFGYDLSHDAARYLVQMDQFKPWRKAAERGKFVLISGEQLKSEEPNAPGSLLSKLNSIYDPWARRGMGMVERKDKKWWLQKMGHKREFIPSYIYYNAEGKPAGYIFYYLKDKGNWEREMVVHDMYGVDRAAWEAIFGFIYNHDSQAKEVSFWTPVDSQLANRFPDPRQAEVKIHPGYMLRLLDVPGAFHQRLFSPEAKGEFTFAVTDEMMPENSGKYSVRVGDGRAAVEKLSDQGDGAGVAMNERTLAQIYSGYLSPEQAAATGQLEVSSAADLTGMQSAMHPCSQPVPYMADDF